MANRRRPARRGRGGAGVSGFGGKVLSFILLVALLGFGFAFLRANHIDSIDAAVAYLRDAGSSMSHAASKVDIKDKTPCNVIKSPNCVTDAGGPTATANSGNGATGSGDGSASSPAAGANDLQKRIAALPVAAAVKTSYSRADYPHWAMASGACDTRELVLRNAGFAVDPSTCRARTTAFVYTEPYAGMRVSDPSTLDIDHVVPLGYADAHGAHSWPRARKQAFANDASQLLAVSASANRSKGDKGPADWMPRSEERCEYVTIWVNTIGKYGLTVTNRDAEAMSKAAGECGR